MARSKPALGMKRNALRRLVLRIVGFVMVCAGLASLPFPIPFGLLSIAVGLVLLIGNSDWVAGQVRKARARSPRFHRSMRRAGRRLPRRLHRVLAATDPRHPPRRQVGL